MEVRGIGKIGPIQDVEVGHFYRRYGYDANPVFFQAVEENASGGNQKKWALEFHAPSKGGARLAELHGPMNVTEVPGVHLRLDSSSLSGDEFSTGTSAGMLLMTNDQALLLATPPRGHGWVTVDLLSGKLLQGRPSGWTLFQRWSLVVDDDDDEIVEVAYDFAQRSEATS